jgi:hypothetical protein
VFFWLTFALQFCLVHSCALSKADAVDRCQTAFAY